MGDFLVFFSTAPVSDTHWFGVRPWSTRLWIFLGDGFRMYSVFRSCWYNTGYISTSVSGVLWFRLQKTAESPQLQFIYGRRHSLRAAEALPHGPDYSADHRDSADAARFFVGRCPCCAGRADSQVPPWRRPRFFFRRQARMLGIMAGMAPKDSYAATQLCLAGFAGDDTARAVFPVKGLDVSVVCNVKCWPCLCSTVELRSCSSSASWSDVNGGFWKNLLYFLRECVLQSRGRFSPWNSGHYFYKQYVAVASATEAFWKNFWCFST